MSSPVVHFEVVGKDPKKLHGFYSSIFGWKIDANNPMNYGLVEAGREGAIGGGIGQAEGSAHATFYIEVPDPQATLDQVGRAGGKTVVPVTVIPNMVTFAMFTDPEGNLVGLVKEEQGQ